MNNIFKKSINNIDNILSDDVTTINNIEEHGIIFLEHCYKDNNIYTKYKNIIDNYHQQYIMGDIFDNSTIKYATNLCSNSYLWEKYLNECQIDSDTIMKLFNEFCNINLNTNLNTKCNRYRTFINAQTEHILTENIKWNNICASIKSIFMGNLINSIKFPINVVNWTEEINTVGNFFIYIMKFTNMRNMVLKWFADILNLNIERKNIENFVPRNLCSDIFMFNITGILYKIINTIKISRDTSGKQKKYIQIINHEYIYEEQCDLIWYDRNRKTTNKYNLITKMFFLLANSVCISYIPILEYSKTLIEHEKNIRGIPEQFACFMPLTMQQQMFTELDEIESIKKENSVLKKNNTMKTWISDYFNNIIDWIYNYKDKNFNVDDILISLLSFVNNNKKMYSNVDLVKILLDMVSSKKITSNPDLRVKSFRILNKILRYNFKHNVEFDVELYILSIFILHNDLKNYNREFKDNINDRVNMYSILCSLKVNNTENFSYIIDNIFKNVDKNEIKNFVNILFNDLSHINESYEYLENIMKNEKPVQYSRQYNAYGEYLYSEIYILHCMFKMIECLFLSPIFCNIISEKDSLMLLSPINTFVNKLHSYDYNYPYKLKNNKLNVDDMLFDICTIFINAYSHIFKINIDSPNVIISSHSNFNFDTLNTLCKKFKNTVPKIFMNFIVKCFEILELLDKRNNMQYPDEFLDLMLGTVIKNPVWLPDCDEESIFDRSTIVKCLVNNNKNPYTGTPLTLEEFEQYNNKKDIQLRAANFKLKMETWEQNNCDK